MKTIRTIIATLSATLLLYAIIAWVSVRQNAAFIQRTIYQGFDQTFVVALVMGCAFLLIAIILTVAIVSTGDEEDEDEEEEEEELPLKPKARPRPAEGQKHPAAMAPPKMGGAYRRAGHTRPMERDQQNGGFERPKAEPPRRKAIQAPAPDDPAGIPLRRGETAIQSETAPLQAQPASDQNSAKEPATPAPAFKAEKAPDRKIEEAHSAEFENGPALDAEDPAQEPEKVSPQPGVEAENRAPEDGSVEETEEAARQIEKEEAPAPEAEEGEKAEDEPVQTEPEEPAAEPASPAPEAPREEATIRCVFCGSSIRRDSVYCPRCGKKL